MKRIATNSLAGWAFALVVGYWVLTFVVPGFWIGIAVRIGLLAAGLAALWAWGPSAFNMLRAKRSPAADRSEILSFLGIATIASGVTWSSVWGLAWYWAGMPQEWTATGHSLFGQYLISIGLALTYTATDVRREVVQPVNWWVVLVLIGAAGAAGYVLGKQNGSTTALIPQQYAQCHPDMDYWVSTRGVIHGQDSPDRWRLRTPSACFATAEEALAMGYRLPEVRAGKR